MAKIHNQNIKKPEHKLLEQFALVNRVGEK